MKLHRILEKLIPLPPRWPRRPVRPPLRILLTLEARKSPKPLNELLAQAGYTAGDRVVVLLESDFRRLAGVASRKVDGPLDAIMMHLLHGDFLQRMDEGQSSTP